MASFTIKMDKSYIFLPFNYRTEIFRVFELYLETLFSKNQYTSNKSTPFILTHTNK
jgi:hypothetical protein